MPKNKVILITGGAGFIGSSLALRLVEDNEIILYDNLHRNSLQDTNLLSKKNIRLVKADVLDKNRVNEWVSNADMVIHMASIAGVDTVMKSPVKTMEVSLKGTMNVLEAALACGKIRRFIDFSTSEVFGRYAYKVTEGDIAKLGVVGEARWTYAVSKLATEHLVLNYYKEYGFPALSIRPFNIYGPRQTGEGAVHHFICRALKNQDLIIHNDGSQIRSWCYIDDIVQGIVLALDNKNALGHAFNIGNPRATVTIYNLAEIIIRLSNSASKLKLVKWDYPDVELRIPNIEKARQILNYEPKVDLYEGLERTIQWYKRKLSK